MLKLAIATFVVSNLLLLPLYAVAQSKIPRCTDTPDAPGTPAPENMVRPKYPKDALHSGRSGNVELRATVASDRRLKDLTVLSGDPEYSASAVTAVRKWHFQVVSEQGHPVEAIYKVHLRFSSVLREANSDVELESPRPESTPPSQPPNAAVQSLGEEVHRMSEPGMVAPKPLYQPAPEFSEASRKEREQGNVNISLVVGTDGVPRDLKVTCSSIPESNQNAINTVKQWKFAPATKDGKPVPFAITVEVSFHLYSQPGVR